MTKATALEPPSHWPADVLIWNSTVEPSGDIVFSSTAGPWSRAHRSGGTVHLEWNDAKFAITEQSVTVDAGDPESKIDLYWNSLLACVYELRGTPTVHGFMAADRNGNGFAILGASGAGKTTTGLALLAMGCELVCDDLIVLNSDGASTGRPFVRRLPASADDGPRDVGGKVRLAFPTTAEPTQLRKVLVLTESGSNRIEQVGLMDAVDQLLQQPHLPFEPHRQGTKHRLLALTALVKDGLIVSIASPRSCSAETFAGSLLEP